MNLQVKASFECQIKQKVNSQSKLPSYVNVFAMLLALMFLAPLPSCIADEQFDSLVNRGTELAQSGEFAKALSWYNKASQLNPRDADCNFDIAQVYKNLKEYSKSRSFYEKAVEYDPKMGKAWNQLASVCLQLNDFTSAELAQKKACQFTPSCRYFNNLAKLYLQQNKLKEARENLLKASSFPEAKQPEHKDIAENLKWVDQHLQAKQTGG